MKLNRKTIVKKLLVVSAMWFVLCLTAFAADPSPVSGSWKADIPHGNGRIYPAILTLEAEGMTLKGKVTAVGRNFPIKDGKINNDEISFSLFGTDGAFTGKLAGNTIKMEVRYDGGESGNRIIPFIARRGE